MPINYESESSPPPLLDRYGNEIDRGNELIVSPTTTEVLHLSLATSQLEKINSDTLLWHDFLYTQQRALAESAPELLAGFTFDEQVPDKPWSPDISKILSHMKQQGTLIEWGSLTNGWYFTMPEAVKQNINEELQWKYAAYTTEITLLGRGIDKALRVEE